MLLGHRRVVELLETQLPSVSVITGPSSVGKRMIAAHCAIVHKVSRVDFTEVKRLTVDEAYRVKRFMNMQPNNNFKFALIDLDNASEAAIQDLLKTVEEPVDYAKFSFISSQKVPDTLRTRAENYSVGLLKPVELKTILLSKGLSDKDAEKVSHLGRVQPALEVYKDIASYTTAISVLSAVEEGDYVLFLQAFKGVDEKAANLIILALQESAAQRWALFNSKSLGAFGNKNVAMNVLNTWSSVSSARPQIAVKVSLESIMKG